MDQAKNKNSHQSAKSLNDIPFDFLSIIGSLVSILERSHARAYYVKFGYVPHQLN